MNHDAHAEPDGDTAVPDDAPRGESFSRPDPGLRRVTIKLTESAYEELKSMAAEQNLSLTGLIRKALATDRFFWINRKAKILLREGSSTREVVLLQDG